MPSAVRFRPGPFAAAIVAAVAAAPSSGCRRPDPAHKAHGVLMFEPSALAAPDGVAPDSLAELRRTFLANQIAVLKSDRVLGDVRHHIWPEDPGQDAAHVAQLRSAITAASREPGLVIDVTVNLSGSPPSVRACDAVMEALIRYRLDDRTNGVNTKLEWMNAQLIEMSKDAGKHAAVIAALRREIDDLETQRQRLVGAGDVRVVNRCVPVS